MSSSSSRQLTPDSNIMTPESSAGDPPPSGFTAVNGRSPSHGGNAEDKSNSGREEHQRSSQSPSQQRQQQPHVTAENHMEREPEDGLRKRKDSTEASPALSDATSQKRQRTMEPQGSSPYNSASSDGFGHPSKDHPPPPESDHTTDHGQSESPWGAMHERNTSINSEAHLAEVLQNNMTAEQMDGIQHHPDPRYPIVHSQPAAHYPHMPGQMQTPPAGTSHKQRKRNFSNRTKTGCFTCRERKKKCDEGKPTCHNCSRGGFTCKGYATNNVFKTQMPREQPVLQAKNGYYEHHRYPQAPVAAPAYYETLPSDNRRPISIDDTRDPARSIPAPQEPTLGSNYGPQGWPDQQLNQHYQRESMGRVDYHQSIPPLRSEPPVPPQQKLPSHHPPVPVHPSHSRSMSQHAPPNGSSGQYPNGQPAQYVDQRMMAQSALDHPSSRQASYEHLTERQKMLRSLPFVNNDPSLKEDRVICAKEVYRYNKNSIEPNNLSDGARREQFRQIIECQDKASSPGSKSRNTLSPQSGERKGTLGLRIEVEAPFYCDYGYNLKIGSDVEIGANCRINDSAHIEIGERTIIGPNVTITTLDADHRAPRGAKEKRLFIARRIIIGEDVFIGAGAIILSGVSIHKGATIGAGTIVHSDVTAATTVVNDRPYKNLAYGSHRPPPPPPPPQGGYQ